MARFRAIARFGAAALFTFALAAAGGCGGEDSSSSGEAGVSTVIEEPEVPEDIGVPVGTATGDRCDATDTDAAESLTPVGFDCDPETEKVVTAGMACDGPTRTGVGDLLECDASRTCGGSSHWALEGERAPCNLGKPQPSPGITPPPTGEGDPCVPGQPVPPGFKCE